jgi:hypothetical protein
MNRPAFSPIKSLLTGAFLVLASCRGVDLAPTEPGVTRDGVLAMASSIARDLGREGPNAWLRYFVDGPEFFMANNGVLQLSNFEEARSFLATFSSGVTHLELTWGDIRVDLVGPDVAVMAAPYREAIVDRAGTTHLYSGYFTGVVVPTGKGLRLRDAHWSSPAGPP